MKDCNANLKNFILTSVKDGVTYVVTIAKEYTEKLKNLCNEYKAVFEDSIDTIFAQSQNDIYQILGKLPGEAICYGFSTK